jgi:NAD(P)-dependent dehydrogenase (short-subunit alcohol dehydrogenase family)
MDLGLGGRAALVVGSTSGLGLAVAQALGAKQPRSSCVAIGRWRRNTGRPQGLAGTVETLLLAQVDLMVAVLPAMRERGVWGRARAIGSSGVHQPIANLVRSDIARAGLAAYLETLAGEAERDGVAG